MTFTSYAQNLEDVILWRALSHIKNGFYIDIGAAWPDHDSVTRAFYERGWSGINVEPNPAFYRLLLDKRPNDINLPVAISDTEGRVVMSVLPDTGLSTLDSSIAATHGHAGWNVEHTEVEVITLERLWRENVAPQQNVHFLKIDVEGLEAAVLRGNDWRINRPWVVVVEATMPLSQSECHGEWEVTLINANYSFAYADGLNRFYVAQEHSDIIGAFKYPPNVFDEYKLFAHLQAEKSAAHAEKRATRAESEASMATQRARRAEATTQQALAELNAVFASKSWRLTAPLRWTFRQLRLLKAHGYKNRFGAVTGKAMSSIVAKLSDKPKLRRRLTALAEVLGVKERLRVFVNRDAVRGAHWRSYSALPVELRSLSREARQIYYQIERAIDKKEEE